MSHYRTCVGLVFFLTLFTPVSGFSETFVIGDCIYVTGYTSCYQYLEHRGNQTGVNLLVDQGCPRCVEKSEPTQGGGTTTFYECEGGNWNRVDENNINTANESYDYVVGEQQGAEVTNLSNRPCRYAGQCEEGTDGCKVVIGEGNMVEMWCAEETGGASHYYVVKETGDLCNEYGPIGYGGGD